LKRYTKYYGFIILAAVCILFMISEIMNIRFWLSDFEVYYNAAKRILHAQNLYQIVEDRHYVFKYSPASAIYFIPFTIFPFQIAKYIYWLFLTSLIVYGFYLSIKMLKPSLIIKQQIGAINITIILATLILAIHFSRELHLGQVNYLLLFLFILALFFYVKHYRILFSFIIASSIFIKPFGLIFLPYFILKKKYYELVLFGCFALVLFFIPFLFYGSMETTLGQYQLWINELQFELDQKQGLLENGNLTLFSVFARYTPIRLLINNSLISFVYQCIILLIIGVVFIWFTRMNSKDISSDQKQYLFAIEFSLLLSIIPLLAYTSVNAFIFTQLLVFIILLHFQSLRTYEKVLAIIAFLFIGGNYDDVIGIELSIIVDNLSLLSFGVLILIYLLYTLRIRDTIKIN